MIDFVTTVKEYISNITEMVGNIPSVFGVLISVVFGVAVIRLVLGRE